MNCDRIKELRKSKGFTQEQLANKIGVKRAVISKYENGTISPSVDQLKRIADALDVPASEILYDGVIRVDMSGYKNMEDMTPEELDKYLRSTPKAMEKLKESFSRLTETLFDLHADDDALLLHFYGELNHSGRKEALKRLRELTQIPEYADESDLPL